MKNNDERLLAGYQPAPLENWYRHNYFNNDIDISGSGVAEYTFQEVKTIAKFSFDELDNIQIKDGETIGSLKVRTQLATLFGTGDPDMVMVTNGANEALQLIVRSILDPGDEIITLGPCYHCHDKIALSMGCSVKKWTFSVDNNFDLDLCQLENLFTKNTKALFLNFPHNPTGKGISQNTLDRILELVRERNIYLVWDGVFQQLVYESPAPEDPIHNYDKAITLGTFSKAYGAPGLRFGWIIAPRDVQAACVRQKDYGNLFVAPITEFVASKMLAQLTNFSIPRLKQAAENRMIVDHWINNNEFNVSWRRPDGGVCGLLKLPGDWDDVAFCNQLLDRCKVLLVPGTCFELPGFVRLGFGGNTDNLREALVRMEKSFRERQQVF
ncbi:MAG: aminotransferase class I/II-fold pyridoxal phosphate-dependent enzyme [Pseudomonadota bacterium]